MDTNEASVSIPASTALLISEELYQGMLRDSEAEFRKELHLWHPDLDARRYLVSRTYPRCWIVTTAIIFAATFTEYARLLLDSLARDPEIIREIDLRVAKHLGENPLLCVPEESWRKTICAVGGRLYWFSPQTQTRAFAVGLNYAFTWPQAASWFTEVVRRSVPLNYDHQVAAAAAVIRVHPVAGEVPCENRPADDA